MAKAKQWVCINPKHFKEAMDQLRHLLNLQSILEKEYQITKKDAKLARKHLEKAVLNLELGLK